jgi:hypothetical protein
MYIEELIDRLATNGAYLFHLPLSISYFDVTIVSSLSEQTNRGNAYTEKQRGLALRLATKYAFQLSTALGVDVAAIIKNPQYKHSLRVLSNIKSINIVDREGVSTIEVHFPYNQELVDIIKKYKDEQPNIEYKGLQWNSVEKCWDFSLSEPNIQFLNSFIESGFIADELFLKYKTEIQEIEYRMDEYIPMIEYVDGHFRYRNVVDHIPQPTSTDLVEVLLHARRHGITCWDEPIDIALESVDPVIYKFLKNTSGEVSFPPGETRLEQISDILNFSKNVLFVIPGGTEIDHLQYVHEYLISSGYQNDQMTVMFRLDSSSGRICNDYIKEHKLNTPLTDKVKFVFVSGKIPKPLIESGKNFDAIIHFGTNSAHYTLKNFVKSHHNVISMNLPNRKNREINFG